MPAHIPSDRVANRLKMTAEKLGKFPGLKWISIVPSSGAAQQISTVPVVEEPPYSSKDVGRIFADNQAAESTSK